MEGTIQRLLASVMSIALLCLCLGCRQAVHSQQGASGGSSTATRTSSSPIVVRDSAGKARLLITQIDDHYDIATQQGQTESLKVKDDRVNLYTVQGKKEGSVKRDDGDFVLDNAQGKKIMKLAAKEGGYRLKDASHTTILKIKPRENGFKISDGAGVTLAKGKREKSTITFVDAHTGAKVERANPMITFVDASGNRLYDVTGTDTEVTGVLLTKKLTPLQQAAFILAATALRSR